MKINPKSEKGAVTLVVLIGMLFLTVFLMSVYIKISNEAQGSLETTKQIAEQYNNIEDGELIYDSYFANTDIIPIYTVEQLKKIGSNEKILIDEKIYTFSPDAYYTLKSDLDLGGTYNSNTGVWSGQQWTAITNDFTGVVDGLGHTISGIYLGKSEETQGIFQNLKGTVKNVYIKNSYKVKNMNGLLAGTNNGEILNCYYEKALIGLKVGDYVNYTPITGTYKVANGENGTGYTTDDEYQEFTTDNTLKWRILSIDEKTGKIELISDKAAHTLSLGGADGYNHAVDILNDLCKKLYSNKNGVTARSITVEDINAKTIYTYEGEKNTTSGLTYGDKIQLSTLGSNYMKYPNLYSREIGFGTGNKFTQKLKENEGLNNGITDAKNVTTYTEVLGSTNGSTANTDPWVTNTYYGFNGSSITYYPEQCLNTNLGINTAPNGLIGTGEKYWLASRCVYPSPPFVRFCLRIVKESNNVADSSMFYNRRR